MHILEIGIQFTTKKKKNKIHSHIIHILLAHSLLFPRLVIRIDDSNACTQWSILILTQQKPMSASAASDAFPEYSTRAYSNSSFLHTHTTLCSSLSCKDSSRFPLYIFCCTPTLLHTHSLSSTTCILFLSLSLSFSSTSQSHRMHSHHIHLTVLTSTSPHSLLIFSLICFPPM